MNINLLMKQREWHPLGEHKRVRCLSIEEIVEGQAALLAITLDLEWNGSSEHIHLSSDNPEFFIKGLQFIYSGGDQHAAKIDINLVDYVD